MRLRALDVLDHVRPATCFEQLSRPRDQIYVVLGVGHGSQCSSELTGRRGPDEIVTPEEMLGQRGYVGLNEMVPAIAWLRFNVDTGDMKACHLQAARRAAGAAKKIERPQFALPALCFSINKMFWSDESLRNIQTFSRSPSFSP